MNITEKDKKKWAGKGSFALEIKPFKSAKIMLEGAAKQCIRDLIKVYSNKDSCLNCKHYDGDDCWSRHNEAGAWGFGTPSRPLTTKCDNWGRRKSMELTIKEQIERLKKAIEVIKASNGYNDERLTNGSDRDSSSGSKYTFSLIKVAEKEFVNFRKGDILKLALKNAIFELAEIKGMIGEIPNED